MEYRVTLKVLKHFFTKRKQSVLWSGQSFSWTNVKAGVPQGCILQPMLFLIYVNDLADGLSSNTSLFADDTSLFSVIRDLVITISEFTGDVVRIKQWLFSGRWVLILIRTSRLKK